MAYSTPSSRSTGSLITAAIWNQDVVDNVIATYARASLGNMAEGGLVNVVSTTSETTLWSTTIPGGTLSTNRFLLVRAYLILNNASGSASSITVRVKYGSTTLQTVAVSLNTSQTVYAQNLGILAGYNSASAQRWISTWSQVLAGTESWVYDGAIATENSAGDLALAITAQPGLSHANLNAVGIGFLLSGPYGG